ncbi:MAG TPA: penicillin acylase family protein, partial [Actinomycetes bacterium]|nr:penicillin acylase family protein [Actinomycetes bacterium]
MRRAVGTVALCASLAVSGSLLAPAGATGAAEPDFGDVLNILPPGQSGTVTATDAAKVAATDPQGRVAVDGSNAPRNFADQLEMYDALNTVQPGSLGESDLTSYYKPATFEVPDDQVLRRETPKPGVTITWDTFGVPHVKGTTRADVAWGAGYAGTKDRMFLQDVLRHAGAARAAEFLGPTDANVAMDQEQLRSAFYTRDEAADQIASLPDRYGAEGTRTVAAADSFVAGINAAQSAMCPLGSPVGPACPAEYAALGKTPKPWDRADVVYVASLVGGIFGKGGGGEYANARWLQQLRQQLGTDQSTAVYEDLRERNDAEAPTTASTPFPYGANGPVDTTLPGVAVPDLDGETAPGTGADAGSDLPVALPSVRSLRGETSGLRLDLPFGDLDLSSVGPGLSNALLVGADKTSTGHPLTVFGPQTSYYAPQLLTEQVLDGPGVKARGVSFAGTQLVVQLGRGVDYAWSATSASNDNVDTVVERLCTEDGSEPTVRSTSYLVGDECVPMDRHVHHETALPNAGAAEPPRDIRLEVLRTRHGIVQLRTTVEGEPVAIVSQRSTYHHEVDSVIGFARLNDPRWTVDAPSFQRAADAIDYTFNWFYTDSRDISYYSSGRLPVRAPGTHVDLPRWGDADHDWQGWLDFAGHPKETNPPSGYLVSWNNKPASGFAAADNVWGYGSVYRSLALSDRIADATRDGGTVTRAQLVGLVADAATVDSRAAQTLPELLDVLGDDPRTADATAALRDWLADGAHRVDRDRDGYYAHQQAVALFDEWWESQTTEQPGDESVARDVLRGVLGGLVDDLPKSV